MRAGLETRHSETTDLRALFREVALPQQRQTSRSSLYWLPPAKVTPVTTALRLPGRKAVDATIENQLWRALALILRAQASSDMVAESHGSVCI